VRDEVSGADYTWAQANFVRLEPWNAVCHLMTITYR
jgi:starch synthase (maltosyl-transferring)